MTSSSRNYNSPSNSNSSLLLSSSHHRRSSAGTDTGSTSRSAKEEEKRRRSSLVLEGIEYDLTNLLLVAENNNDGDASDDNDNSQSSSSESDSGFLTCRSRPTTVMSGNKSCGTMSRNISNASSVFDNNPATTTTTRIRESPYRFDLRAMKMLMSSFRGIPELKDSFRLSKQGRVLEMDQDSDDSNTMDVDHSDHSYAKDEEEEFLHHLGTTSPSKVALLGSAADYEEDDGDEDDLLVPNRCNISMTCSTASTITSATVNTTPPEQLQNLTCVDSPLSTMTDTTTTTTAVPEQHYNHNSNDDDGMDDLIYDEATGTYRYKDDDYVDACQSETDAQQSHYTSLEELAAKVEQGPVSTHGDDDDEEDEEHEMEISPGVYVPFRGAKETWQAVATQTTVELTCLDCQIQLVCINDCEYTVCPDCRVVNPVFCDDPVGRPFGVGMGFKKEWVIKKQMEQQHQQQIEENRRLQEELEKQQQQQQRQQQELEKRHQQQQERLALARASKIGAGGKSGLVMPLLSHPISNSINRTIGAGSTTTTISRGRRNMICGLSSPNTPTVSATTAPPQEPPVVVPKTRRRRMAKLTRAPTGY